MKKGKKGIIETGNKAEARRKEEGKRTAECNLAKKREASKRGN